ncbi:hypothetical protein R3X27_18835 [Tropicimonas sp. TH_r6]|uniref:hypothetical protein n=1 Tax=Tropicimonas sp. TH_r6 TaxID=3082085 RepID=UPI0029538C2C|nr:hypothetical protein [Tropicimonas sp. TH_r6]MDV7144742.1 hypothetical protein [Tropicimonas sp. TH_r6]
METAIPRKLIKISDCLELFRDGDRYEVKLRGSAGASGSASLEHALSNHNVFGDQGGWVWIPHHVWQLLLDHVSSDESIVIAVPIRKWSKDEIAEAEALTAKEMLKK